MTVAHHVVRRALDILCEQLEGGSFAVTDPDGVTKRYGSGEPLFTVRINDDKVIDVNSDDLLTNFGEAYMDGRLDVEGDLAALVSLALRSGLISVSPLRGFAGAALRAFGKRRSVAEAKKNVARHYDLGNDFFRLWLDDSLTYSCAYCRNASDSLEPAQRQKLDHSLHKVRLPHMRRCWISAAAGAPS